jgi:LysM repeat protein
MSLTSVSAGAPSHRRPLPVSRRQTPRPLRLLRLVVLVTVVFLAIWGGAQVAQAIADRAPQGTIHMVEPGDTVWQIVVEEYGAADHDVRDLVDRVLAANDLADAQVMPGQEIVLPLLED